MTIENLSYYGYIKELYRIADISEEQIMLLNAYNAYISSNKDFKYNKTYLDDSIDNFKLCLLAFRDKLKLTRDFAERLSKKYDSLNNWIIIVDDVFIIDSKFNFSLLIDKIKSEDEVSGILVKCLEKFNLFSLNKNYIKVMYFDQINNRDYTESLKMKDSIEILYLVSKELKEKVKNEKDVV